ncbi:AAA domain-containing protein [Xylariales sp. PMI_506]|nr:AAA domain-containing protein [Xylariales sp. PMI_506]
MTSSVPSRTSWDDHTPKSLVKKTLAQTLRLATVDNFQGEKAKIIIVSLVQSNPERKVGFLRTENRINVLLSRAQHGIYQIGNAATYLHVPIHPQTDILCSEPEDFTRKSLEGDCGLPCKRRLQAYGHQCQARCHSDMMHQAVDCAHPCQRFRTTCDHTYPKVCGQDYGWCLVKIKSVMLPYGHVKRDVACDQAIGPENIKCDVEAPRTVPGCEHMVMVACFRDMKTEDLSLPNALWQTAAVRPFVPRDLRILSKGWR